MSFKFLSFELSSKRERENKIYFLKCEFPRDCGRGRVCEVGPGAGEWSRREGHRDAGGGGRLGLGALQNVWTGGGPRSACASDSRLGSGRTALWLLGNRGKDCIVDLPGNLGPWKVILRIRTFPTMRFITGCGLGMGNVAFSKGPKACDPLEASPSCISPFPKKA